MEPIRPQVPALPQLILNHCSQLTCRTAEQARAQVPWYRSLPPDTLDRMVSEDYQRLAQTLQSNDLYALRTYIEQTGQERLQMGAPAESLIAVATLMEANVRRLIDTEWAIYPLLAHDATRRMQATTRNIGMILRGLNLRQRAGEKQRPLSGRT